MAVGRGAGAPRSGLLAGRHPRRVRRHAGAIVRLRDDCPEAAQAAEEARGAAEGTRSDQSLVIRSLLGLMLQPVTQLMLDDLCQKTLTSSNEGCKRGAGAATDY
eukprot:9485635-Pyramimonas_sp.AAC.1